MRPAENMQNVQKESLPEQDVELADDTPRALPTTRQVSTRPNPTAELSSSQSWASEDLTE
jgi:hypothetical protein